MSQSLKEAMQILLNQHPTPEYDADKLLRELLCVFCRDGGQTIEERGVLGAIEVAQGNFYAMNEVCERLKSFTESINKNAILGPVSFSTELKPTPYDVHVKIVEAPGSGLGFPAARESGVTEAPKKRLLSGNFSFSHKDFANFVRQYFDGKSSQPNLLDTKAWSEILSGNGYPKWVIDVVVKRLGFNVLDYKHTSDILNFIVRVVGTKPERQIEDWHPDDCNTFFAHMKNMEFGNSRISIEYALQLMRAHRVPQWIAEEITEDAYRTPYVPLKGLMEHVNYLVNKKD